MAPQVGENCRCHDAVSGDNVSLMVLSSSSISSSSFCTAGSSRSDVRRICSALDPNSSRNFRRPSISNRNGSTFSKLRISSSSSGMINNDLQPNVRFDRRTSLYKWSPTYNISSPDAPSSLWRCSQFPPWKTFPSFKNSSAPPIAAMSYTPSVFHSDPSSMFTRNNCRYGSKRNAGLQDPAIATSKSSNHMFFFCVSSSTFFPWYR
mmetsp:Transcript_44343/g.107194  ORF Transcript_44343/g.107194 Transcript_44343/m.107194 type:complete len:206 (+) Transcript_44343:256-873(+)